MGDTFGVNAGRVRSVNGASGDVVIGGVNLFSFINNKHYAVYNSGAVAYSELSWSTDYMDCSGVKCLTAQLWAKVDKLNIDGEGLYLHISYFTAEKTFIRKDFVNTHIVTDYIDHVSLLSIPPNGAKYFIGGVITHNGGELSDESLKIEIGNVPTQWTPAPEDILSRLEAIEAKLNITSDPAVADGPGLEEDMSAEKIPSGGGNIVYVVTALPALIGGVRHG